MRHGRAGERAAPVVISSHDAGQAQSNRGKSAGRVSAGRPMLDRRVVELVQRGWMILEAATADVEVAESQPTPSEEMLWSCRSTLAEAVRAWEALKAELGPQTVRAALEAPTTSALELSPTGSRGRSVALVLIGGFTYAAVRVPGVELAPIQWRIIRLRGHHEIDPYYVCRLADGAIQCDCAEWTYRIAETERHGKAHCKHSAALVELGWI